MRNASETVGYRSSRRAPRPTWPQLTTHNWQLTTAAKQPASFARSFQFSVLSFQFGPGYQLTTQNSQLTTAAKQLDPNGGQWIYQYDSLGRLAQQADAGDGSIGIARSGSTSAGPGAAEAYTVTLATAGGKSFTHEVIDYEDGRAEPASCARSFQLSVSSFQFGPGYQLTTQNWQLRTAAKQLALPAGQTSVTYTADREPNGGTAPQGTLGFDDDGKLIQYGPISYDYDDDDYVTKVSSSAGDGSVEYGYGGKAAPTTITWAGPVAGTVTIGRNAQFQATSIGVGGAHSVAITPDADGVVSKVGDLTIERSPATAIISTKIGGVTDHYQRNQFAEPTFYEAKHGDDTLFSEEYLPDQGGRIKSKTVRILNPVTDEIETFEVKYDYNPPGQLNKVQYNDQPVIHYDYDGNTASFARSCQFSVSSFQFGPGYQLTTDNWQLTTAPKALAYDYDTTGALETKTDVTDPFDPDPPTTTYTYDDFGNLRHVALPDGRSIDYLIDATQRRVGRILKDTTDQAIDERRWLYQSGLRPVAELDGNNQVQTFFVYADKPNVPEYMERGGQKYRIITDHLGSLRLVAHTATGEIMQRMLHDEHGNVIEDYVASGWDPVPFGFAGGIYDRDTELVRFGARDFDPEIARWTAQDPIGFGGGDGNLYGYVHGDPVNFIDPDGAFAQFVVGAATSIATGAAIAFLTGDSYGLKDVATDTVSGAVGVGLASKAQKLYRIAKLRRTAKAKGLAYKGRVESVETWQDEANHLRRLKIKHQKAKHATGSGSQYPRFEFRTDAGTFWDPFTGQVGLSGALSHIPLEPPLSSTAAGVAGAVAGAVTRNWD